MSFAISALTASERASPKGPSTASAKSLNSTAQLLTPAAVKYQSPSPILVVLTSGVAGGAGACATFAGTSSATGAFGLTEEIFTSSTGKPSCISTIWVGNLTPEKSA